MKDKLRGLLLRFLGISETYVAVDIMPHSTSTVIVIKCDIYSNTLDVIYDQSIKSNNYQSIVKEINRIARNYGTSNIIYDKPFGLEE